MLKREHRLRKKKDIDKIFKKGKGVYDSLCGVRFLKNSSEDSRFAIVVSTKVSKHAVERNRIRRQYREILRELLAHIEPGYDVVLLTSKPVIGASFSEKEQSLKRVLTRAKLMKSDV